MLLRKFDRDNFFDAADVQCQMIYPWDEVAPTPFKAAWGLVEPGRKTRPHGHHDGETFLIVQGNGRMSVDAESTDVGPGDVIYMRPFETHTIENTSPETDLLFLTLWWEDVSQLEDAKTDAAAEPRKRYLVTSSPPTPNGYMHVGHISGPYLSGDICTRYLRLRGADVSFICHTDDNESLVRLKAKQVDWTDRQVADEFTAAIARALEAAHIEMDSFLRPNNTPEHVPMVEMVFRKLYDDGVLIEKDAPAPYCESCDIFLFEAFVVGECPYCGNQDNAFSCEQCYRPIDCTELLSPRCMLCGEEPVERRLKRLYFPLSRYTDQLREYYRSSDMGPCVRSLCERMLADGLPDIAFSHRIGWGTPVPVEGYPDQTIYGAFEVLVGFFVACQKLAEKKGLEGGWRSFFADEDVDVVQFFGSDNCYFFGVLYPALCLAYDQEIRLPKKLVTNEYYLLEGTKFSTSLGHLIRVEEMLEEVPVDVMRFYLAYTAPEVEQTNFSRTEFQTVVERELVGSWETWLAALGDKVRESFGGEAPVVGSWTGDHRRYYQQVMSLVHQAAAAYEAGSFSPQRAARVLCELVRLSRRFSQAERYWAGLDDCQDERGTGVALELLGAKTLAILAAPILPGFAGRLWSELGFTEELGSGAWESVPTWLEAGQRIGWLGGPYFETSFRS